MPSKQVVSIEGNLRNYGITAADLAEEREALDPAAMAEMLYQGFEQGVDELAQRGISMPPPTDMNGRPMPGYENYYQGNQGQPGMRRVASGNGSMPPSSSEGAIATLMEVRDDMLRKYSSMSQDPVMAPTMAMSIQKIETQIISMGGEVDRFDPAKYQSGLKPVGQSIDPMVAANKVVDNTQQTYTLRKIESIYAGKNKTGKAGVCVKIASAPGVIVHGTVVPREPRGNFTGNEVIDFVPDSGRGRMTVKTASRGYWEDVSGDFEIAWRLEEQK